MPHSSSSPVRDATLPDPQAWLRALQEQLLDRVGEPVLLTIRMAFDEWFEVEVSTFTERWGTAAGAGVAEAIEGAVEMLLEMDMVLKEIASQSK